MMAHACQDLPFVQQRTTQADIAKLLSQISAGAPKDDGGFDF